MSCDHKFIDSNTCAKCGVHIEQLRAANAADWLAWRDNERELTADELDIDDMVGNMHLRVSGAWALLGGMGDGTSRERVARAYELAPKLYQLIPFLKALGRLALEQPERMRELWAAALVEPMPFGMAPVGDAAHEEGGLVSDEKVGDWIFTFGHGHVHPVTKEPLHRRFVRIHGTESGARHKMALMFGIKWAFQYPTPDEAGLARFQLTELPESEWPDPFPTHESQVANHEIMAIRDLRAPYHRHMVESMDPDFMLRFVLVAGSIGDYTVYMGIGPAEWVRDFGNKAPFQVAAAVFSGLEERRYRE